MFDISSIGNIFVYLPASAYLGEFVGFLLLIMKNDAIVAPPVMEFRDRTALAAAATAAAPASASAEAAAVAEEQTFVMLSFIFNICSGKGERISPTLSVFRKYLTP